jgi:hypothetical protein
MERQKDGVGVFKLVHRVLMRVKCARQGLLFCFIVLILISSSTVQK